ncbi:MAG: hypothetical protein ACREQV_26715, partial [Candidatus Binatia bacterium]
AINIGFPGITAAFSLDVTSIQVGGGELRVDPCELAARLRRACGSVGPWAITHFLQIPPHLLD